MSQDENLDHASLQNINTVKSIIESSKTLDEAITRLHDRDFPHGGILEHEGETEVYVEDIVEPLDDFEREIRKRENNENVDYGGEKVEDLIYDILMSTDSDWPPNTPPAIAVSIRNLKIRQR